MRESQFALLGTRRFLPLFVTQFLGAFNDNVYKNALVILITYVLAARTNLNGQVMVTLAAGIFILPFFLFSATAGQLADRYDKAMLIRWIKLAEILIMLAAAIGFYFSSVPFLVTVLFLLGTQATFFGPLKYGILPDQLGEEELIGGNAFIEAGTFLAILLGTIVGGLVILAHHGAAIVSLLVLAVAVGGWAASRYILPTQSGSPDLKVSYNIVSETWRIVRHAAASRVIFLCILGISWFWLVGGTFLAQFPSLTKDVVGGDQQVVTLFLTVFSVGIALGLLLCNRLLKGAIHATYVPLGAVGITLFSIDLFFATGHPLGTPGQLLGAWAFLSHAASWRILLDLLLIAVSGGVYIVPLYALLQERSEPSHRARNIASNNVINAAFMVLSALATVGMLELGFSVPQVFLVTALLNAGVAVYISQLLPGALVKAMIAWLLETLYRVDVQGIKNYFKAGDRVLIVANHLSFLDAVLIAAYVPDPLTFAVDTRIAKQSFIRYFLWLAKTHPVDPTNPMATRALIEAVRRGEKLVIFPEGRITVTGSLMKVYEGPGLVADKAGAMLLPVRLDGAQYTPFSRLRGKVRIRWFPKIRVQFLEPRTFDVPAEIKGRKRRQYAADRLYALMAEMLFESSDYRHTLFQSLLDARKTHGARHPVLEDVERKPLGYSRLITASFVLGRRLAAGSRPGEHVGLLLPNATGTAVAFFGLHAFGRVPAMLNFSTGTRNAVLGCQSAAIRTVYTSRRFLEMARLADMAKAIEGAGVRLAYLEDVRERIGRLDKVLGLVGRWIPQLYYLITSRQRDPDTAAAILFTSGTEGAPKGVVLTHANLQANRYQVVSRIDFGPTDTVFNALPMFHSFGLTCGTILPILSGVRAFLYPSPLHYRIVPELAYETNATIMFGTDTFLSGYARFAHPYDFYSMRYVFAGAERLKGETRRLWSEKFGIRILEGYGATETGPVLALNTPMQNRTGSVGRLVPGITSRLEPIPGIEEGGRLLVSRPERHGGLPAGRQAGGAAASAGRLVRHGRHRRHRGSRLHRHQGPRQALR